MGCKTSKPVAVLPWDPNRNPSNNADAREKKGCEFSMEQPSSRGAQVSKFEEHGIDVCIEEPQRERSEGPYDSPSRGYSNDPVYNASEPFGNAFYPRRNHSMPSLKERVQNDPSATDTRVRVDTKLQQCFGRTNTESPKCGSDGSFNGEQKSHQVSGSLIELDVSPNVYETIVNHCVFCKTRESRGKGYKLLRHHSIAEVSPRQYTSDACDLDKLPTCLCTECRQKIASRWRTSRHRTNATSKGKKSQARSRLSPGKHAEQKKYSPTGKDHQLDKSQAQRNQMEHRRRRRIDPERAKRLRHEAAGSFLKKGMKVSSYYEFSETIGKGRFGTIFKGINKVTGQQVALKRIDLATTQTEYVLAELQCLVSRHGSFVRLVELYEEGNYLWVVMELMRSELLSEVMNSGTFSETRAVDLVHVVARGLRFLHQNLYVHRDLKPENILIGYNDEFKLADFGLARQLKAYQDGSVETLSGTCGTWAYNAPEMRAQREKYGRSADIWALGVILFIVLSGYHPFDPDGKGEKESMLEAVVGNQWSFGDKCWRRVSGDAKDLISWMLARNPEDRPSPSEVLSHPWFAMSGANLNARFTRSEADATGNAAVQRYRASQTSSYHQSNNSGSACASPNPFGAHGRDYRPNFSAAIEEAEDLTA